MTSLLTPSALKSVENYIAKLGLKNPVFNVTNASKNGDNYSGDVYRIVITSTNETSNSTEHYHNDSIQIIAKTPPKNQLRRKTYNSALYFSCELYAFEHMLPALEQFQLKYILKSDIFNNYPIMYDGSNELEHEFILLNDLKLNGYTNQERTISLTPNLCKLVLTNLAKFHAISFALKDQQPEQFDELAGSKYLAERLFVSPMHDDLMKFLKNQIGYALSTLDTDHDREIISKVQEFGMIYGNFMAECCGERQDAIILHGDCWMSNLMFREMDNKTDVCFLDWQAVRYGTVAIDLSYFICCCTDTTVRQQLPELLRLYYDTLISQIDVLGSSGEKLFPYDRFLWHMKKYMRFGFGMALMSLHAICCKSEELANIQEILNKTEDMANLKSIGDQLITNPVYKKRMSDLCRDLVQMGYL